MLSPQNENCASAAIVHTKLMYDIYLDHNATTAVHPQVLKKTLPFYAEIFGNPSSIHRKGVQARDAIEQARYSVAQLLSCEASELWFTSGGTEANNLAVGGILASGGHAITSSIEHPSILESVAHYTERNGCGHTVIAADTKGVVAPELFKRAVRKDTKYITAMVCNNLLGTVQDIAGIAAVARECGAHFHSDAVQAAGKMPLDVRSLDIDSLSVSGHKIGAPKGIGALYIRKGVKVSPLVFGGGQESQIRPGTENVTGIIAFGEAARIAKLQLNAFATHCKQLRDTFLSLLSSRGVTFTLIAPTELCISSTLNVSFPGLRAQAIVESLAYYGIYASTCSACSNSHTSKNDVCPPLRSMGLDDAVILGSIRFSFGMTNTINDIVNTVDAISYTVKRLQTLKS